MRGLMMDYPLTVGKIIQRANRVFADKEVVSILPSGRKHRYTNADLYRRTVRLMNVLRRLGVKPGERVGTFMWNHHRHLELYFAIPSMGAVTHTLNIRLFPDQLAYIVNHAADAVIFVDASLLPALEAVAPQLKTVRQFVVVTEDNTEDGTEDNTGDGTEDSTEDGMPPEATLPETTLPETTLSPIAGFEALMADADETEDFPELDEFSACGMCYTSGTTGHPKGVVYSHRGIYIHTLMAGMTDMLGFGERETVLPVVPMFHANAWSVPFLAAMVGAKTVYAGQNVSPEALVPLIREEGVTFTLGVPTIWNAVLQYLRKEGGGLGELRTMIVGGSSAPPAMIRAYREEYGIEFIHAWGMTETSPLGTVNRLKKKMDHWTPEHRMAALTRVGIPAPIVELRIVDDQGQEVPPDGASPGELLVRGPAVASAYYNNPDSAVQFTEDGWFRTGDVATRDENAIVQITDRTKDLIKSGGEWISSVEMENAIMACEGVLEAAVVARPDLKYDERPVAFVVPAPGGKGVDPARIIESLSGQFAKWQLPAPEDIRQIDQIPKTSVGKFDKKVLRARLEG